MFDGMANQIPLEVDASFALVPCETIPFCQEVEFSERLRSGFDGLATSGLEYLRFEDCRSCVRMKLAD